MNIRKSKIFLSLLFAVSSVINSYAQVPSNDLCSNAQPIEINYISETCLVGSTFESSSENILNTCDIAPAGKEVWYKFVLTGDSTHIKISPAGLTPISNIVASLQTSCNPTFLFDCFSSIGNADLEFDIISRKGEIIWLSIESNSSEGDFELCISSKDNIMPGDDCASAEQICQLIDFQLNSMENYTLSAVSICGEPFNKKDAWIKFTVGQSGNLEFIIDPNDSTEFDWSLFKITDGCDTKIEISCNKNYASFPFPLNCEVVGANTGMLASSAGQSCPNEFEGSIPVGAGETYAILISNYDNNNSGFSFTWANSTFKLDVNSDINTTPLTHCDAPANISITNNSFGLISNYAYSFEDGIVLSGATLPTSYAYINDGDYLLSVVAESNSGCTNATSKRIKLNSAPSVVLNPSDTAFCLGDSAQINSTITFGTPYIEQNFNNANIFTITNNSLSGINSDISVAGINPAMLKTGTVREICFTITHPRHEDIEVLELVSPSGITYPFNTLPLFGSGTKTYCFQNSIISSIAGNANGTWRLHIEDRVDSTDNVVNEGSLDSWSITLLRSNTITSYSWSKLEFISDTNSLNPIVKPDFNTPISLTVFDENGCSGRDTANIEILSLPNATFQKSDTICIGDSALFTVKLDGISPFDFNLSNGINVTNHTDTVYSFYEKNNGNLSILSLSDAICSSKPTNTVNLLALSVITIDTVRTICNSTNTKFVVEIDILGSNNVLYTVTGGDGEISIGSTTTFRSDSLANLSFYSYTISDRLGCSSITVDGSKNCLCEASANLSSGDTICFGDSVQFTVDLEGTAPWNLYFSDAFGKFSKTNINTSTYTFYHKNNGVLSLDSVRSAVCSSPITDKANIKVNSLPTYSISGNDTVCQGDSINILLFLTGASPWSADIFNGTSTTTYSSDSSTILFSKFNSNTFKVSALSDKNCAGKILNNPKNIVVIENDTADFSYSKSIYCANGANPTPTFSSSTNTGGVFVVQPATITMNSSTGSLNLASGTLNTNYVITYFTTSPYCPDLHKDTIRITPIDVAAFEYSDSIFCPNGKITPTLDGQTVLGGTFSSNPLIGINASTGEVDLTSGTVGSTYSITYTTPAAGCQSSSTEKIKIKLQDKATFNYPSAKVCGIDSITPILDINTPTGGVFSINNSAFEINSSTGTVLLDSLGQNTLIVYYTTPVGICQSTDSFELQVIAAPYASDVTVTKCEDFYLSQKHYDFDLTSLRGEILFSVDSSIIFSWFHDSLLTESVNTIKHRTVKNEEVIYVVSNSGNLCFDTSKVNFVVHTQANAGADNVKTIGLYDEEKNLTSYIREPKENDGFWLNPSGETVENGIILPIDYGDGKFIFTYIDTASSPCVSADTAYLELTILWDGKLIVPNGFTPNNDGINDTWDIQGLNRLYPTCKVLIFNQWGEKVFESEGYTTPWDGTRNGKEVEANTYFYILDYNNGTPPVKNTVTVIK